MPNRSSTSRPALKKTLRRLFGALLFTGGLYVITLLFPSPLFAYKTTYRQATVFSDRPIDGNIKNVLDDAFRRMAGSDLYDEGQHFRLFICNDLWRFGWFTQGSTLAGGVAQYDLTRNIFFRPCDIAANRIIPPDEWYFARFPFAFADRPLSYYFAHEMTHVLQSRYTGRGSWRYPLWLTEGYAEYIGKGGDFDWNTNLRLWHENAPELDPSKGLYRLYQLQVQYLLENKRLNIKQLYENVPDEADLKAELWALPVN